MPPDQLHVAEDARVTGEVDLRPVLERDDDPARLARVVPSSVLDEWKAFVIVNLTPSTSTVPPLFGSCVSATPWFESQPASSTGATTGHECFFARSTASPTWSPCPCVIAITSTRSGVTLLGGALRVPVQERIDVDAFPAGRLDAERRVAQPGESSGHDASVTKHGVRGQAT